MSEDIIKMVGLCNNLCSGWSEDAYLGLCDICKDAVRSSIPCSLDHMEMEEIWRRTKDWREGISQACRQSVWHGI